MLVIPSLGKILLNNPTVVPKILLEETIWSPVSSNDRQHDKIALIPEEVAIQRSVPSSAASLSSNVLTVGLVNLE